MFGRESQYIGHGTVCYGIFMVLYYGILMVMVYYGMFGSESQYIGHGTVYIYGSGQPYSFGYMWVLGACG
jgi:hypothetical protein